MGIIAVLQTKREIWISDLHVSTRDSGVLERERDNKEYQTHLVGSFRNKVHDLFGDLRPTVMEQRDLSILLPKLVVWAWLNSGPNDEAFCGSELVVICFVNDLSEIVAKVSEVVSGLDWAKESEDYDV